MTKYLGFLSLLISACIPQPQSFSLGQLLNRAPAQDSASLPSVPPSVTQPGVPAVLPQPSVAPLGAIISINPGTILHSATTHVIGVNRNHIAGQTWSFPNANAKMQAMLQLTPTWGEKRILYRIGHGPTDGRMDMGAGYDGFHFLDHFGTAASYPFDSAGYPYDDLRNSLSEANTMNADQIHVVNFGTSNPNEAGQYVSYLNHSGDANRALHPFAEQNAQLFELGNEISWDQVRGHAQYAPDEITYATRANLFSQTMRLNSDVPIKIGAVMSANLSLTGNGWSGGGSTAQNILNTMGANVDFLIYHGYSGWPMSIEPGSQPPGVSLTAAMESYFAQVEYHRGLLELEVLPVIKNYNHTSGRDVFLANTEFLSSYNDPATARGMFGALFSADETVEAMNHDIRTSVNFCLSHGELGDSLMFLNDDPNQVTAVFRFLRLLAKHWGDKIVDTTITRLAAKTFTNSGTTVAVSRLQISASASTDGSQIFLLVVNPLDDQDVTASIALPWSPSHTTAYELSGTQGLMSSSTQTSEVITQNALLQNKVFKHASITIIQMTK